MVVTPTPEKAGLHDSCKKHWPVVPVRTAFCRPFQLGLCKRRKLGLESVVVCIPNHDEGCAASRILVSARRDHAERCRGRQDASHRRLGVVIGPVYLVLWGLISEGDRVFERDPVAPGPVAFLVFAFIVGSLTTILYISALKLVHHLTSHRVLAGHPRG
jgi:hypothetical protein